MTRRPHVGDVVRLDGWAPNATARVLAVAVDGDHARVEAPTLDLLGAEWWVRAEQLTLVEPACSHLDLGARFWRGAAHGLLLTALAVAALHYLWSLARWLSSP